MLSFNCQQLIHVLRLQIAQVQLSVAHSCSQFADCSAGEPLGSLPCRFGPNRSGQNDHRGSRSHHGESRVRRVGPQDCYRRSRNCRSFCCSRIAQVSSHCEEKIVDRASISIQKRHTSFTTCNEHKLWLSFELYGSTCVMPNCHNQKFHLLRQIRDL